MNMTREEALDLLEHGDWFQVVYNNLPESTASKVADAINTVAETFRSVPTGEPLTLQQLREMKDKPAYLKVFDPLLKSGWHIIKAVTEDKIIFRGWQTVYVPIDGMGIDYNLYRRPPEGEEDT